MKRSDFFSPFGSFKLPIDEWAFASAQAGGGGGGGGRTSGSLLRCLLTSPRSGPVVRSEATLMQQKLPFSNTYTVSLQIIGDFLRGGKFFRLRSLQIFTHVVSLSFDRVDLGPSV